MTACQFKGSRAILDQCSFSDFFEDGVVGGGEVGGRGGGWGEGVGGSEGCLMCVHDLRTTPEIESKKMLYLK